MKVQPCKFCGNPILWCVDDKGQRIPVDLKPAVYMVTKDNGDNAAVVERLKFIPRGADLCTVGVNHFATCPKAAEVKAAQKKGAPP